MVKSILFIFLAALIMSTLATEEGCKGIEVKISRDNIKSIIFPQVHRLVQSKRETVRIERATLSDNNYLKDLRITDLKFDPERMVIEFGQDGSIKIIQDNISFSADYEWAVQALGRIYNDAGTGTISSTSSKIESRIIFDKNSDSIHTRLAEFQLTLPDEDIKLISNDPLEGSWFEMFYASAKDRATEFLKQGVKESIKAFFQKYIDSAVQEFDASLNEKSDLLPHSEFTLQKSLYEVPHMVNDDYLSICYGVFVK